MFNDNKQNKHRVKMVERFFPNHDRGPVLMLDGDEPIPEWAKKRAAAGTLVIIVDDIDQAIEKRDQEKKKRHRKKIRAESRRPKVSQTDRREPEKH